MSVYSARDTREIPARWTRLEWLFKKQIRIWNIQRRAASGPNQAENLLVDQWQRRAESGHWKKLGVAAQERNKIAPD